MGRLKIQRMEDLHIGGSFFLVKLTLVAFCHIKFQIIPSLMPFTLANDSQVHGLEVSLSNILMIDDILFRSNNRIVLFF